MSDAAALLAICRFPTSPASVDLAVSGGADSVGLMLLALRAQLEIRVHHVDHHAREGSAEDARFVEALCGRFDVEYVLHDVRVPPGANFEVRARAARRRSLPAGVLTGHTMDDVAETLLLNLVRGTGLDGLAPMRDDPTKPLVGLRRGDVRAFVASSGVPWREDPTNATRDFRRNRVRLDVLPLLNEVAARDVVPLLGRTAELVAHERAWLDELGAADRSRALDAVDCRELRGWPSARLTRWLRFHLRYRDEWGDEHPPSAAEMARVLDVVNGVVVATQLGGARRLSRSRRHLRLEGGSTTLTDHG